MQHIKRSRRPTAPLPHNITLPALDKKVDVIYAGPPPWERQWEEDWIWNERELRFRKRKTSDAGMSIARSSFSILKREEVYRYKTPSEKFKEGVQANIRSIRYWMIRRAGFLSFVIVCFLTGSTKDGFTAGISSTR